MVGLYQPEEAPGQAASSLVIVKVPYTKSGKCGNMVWQRNRYGQVCYPAFIPFNPNTPAQRAVRGNLGAVSKRWRTLTQDQREVWIAVARTKWSKPRLGRGRLFGCQFFVKVNVALVNRGMAQVDLPPGYAARPQLAVAYPFHTARFDQPSVGPTLFLKGNRLLAEREGVLRRLAVRQPT